MTDMPHGKENKQVGAHSEFKLKEDSINDFEESSSSDKKLQHNREEFAQELNPLYHVPLALEMNKFDEITTCVKDREKITCHNLVLCLRTRLNFLNINILI